MATLFLHRILDPVELVLGLVLGSAIGVYMARTVPMTKMPEMVAAFNGFGGGADQDATQQFEDQLQLFCLWLLDLDSLDGLGVVQADHGGIV